MSETTDPHTWVNKVNNKQQRIDNNSLLYKEKNVTVISNDFSWNSEVDVSEMKD